MKIFQELEKIFKYRLLSNKEIPGYINNQSRLGKIDDVKRNALLILILHRLGEIEDEGHIKIDQIMPPSVEPIQDVVMGALRGAIEENKKEEFICECGKTAKSELGLKIHKASHKKKE